MSSANFKPKNSCGRHLAVSLRQHGFLVIILLLLWFALLFSSSYHYYTVVQPQVVAQNLPGGIAAAAHLVADVVGQSSRRRRRGTSTNPSLGQRRQRWLQIYRHLYIHTRRVLQRRWLPRSYYKSISYDASNDINPTVQFCFEIRSNFRKNFHRSASKLADSVARYDVLIAAIFLSCIIVCRL